MKEPPLWNKFCTLRFGRGSGYDQFGGGQTTPMALRGGSANHPPRTN
jgi:hypothetical protein